MELKILKNGNLQIDDARIIFRNLEARHLSTIMLETET